MTTPNVVTTGEPPRIVRVEALAFYDGTGRIRHMHHAIVLEGATPRGYDDMLAEARQHAAALDNDVGKLKVLHVRHPFNFAAPHRVDVKKRALVELKPPTRTTTPVKKKRRRG